MLRNESNVWIGAVSGYWGNIWNGAISDSGRCQDLKSEIVVTIENSEESEDRCEDEDISHHH